MCTLVNAASKQLKVPRIYNALITTDQKLQPSQAYPALTPVVQSIQYPVPGYFSTTYNTIIPAPYNAAPGGRSFSYALKQDYFSYNYYENDVPVATDQPGLFTPATKHLVYGGSVPDDGAIKKFPPPVYPYGVPYPIPAPAATTHQATFVTDDPQYVAQPPKILLNNPIQFKSLQYSETGASHSEQYDESATAEKGDSTATKSHLGDKDPQNERHNNDQSTDNLVKNNRPQDPSIVDIPPEPLPIGRPKNKKTDDYPPPPGGLFF